MRRTAPYSYPYAKVAFFAYEKYCIRASEHLSALHLHRDTRSRHSWPPLHLTHQRPTQQTPHPRWTLGFHTLCAVRPSEGCSLRGLFGVPAYTYDVMNGFNGKCREAKGWATSVRTKPAVTPMVVDAKQIASPQRLPAAERQPQACSCASPEPAAGQPTGCGTSTNKSGAGGGSPRFPPGTCIEVRQLGV